MSGTSEWTVTEPQKLVFDAPVDTVRVRIVGGAVNVVGVEEGPARLEVGELDGPPLLVSLQGGVLTVGYEDLPWKGFLKWLGGKGWERHAVVSLAVPQHTRAEVGVVGAGAVISGLAEALQVRAVNGDVTLVGVAGSVSTNTVSGNVEAQAVSGDLQVSTVSGDLTVVEGGSARIKAESVSGNMVLDLAPATTPPGADVRLTTVSGEIAVRIPDPANADVDANTASGAVSCAFEDLRVSGQWGAKRITGRIGTGGAHLKATTVSGAIALLRRPPVDDEPVGASADGTPSFRKDI